MCIRNTDGVRCAVWRAGRGGILDIGPIKSDTAHAFRAKLQAPPRDAENSIPYRIPYGRGLVRDERTHAGRQDHGSPRPPRRDGDSNHLALTTTPISNRRSWLDKPGGSPSTATHPLQRVHERTARGGGRGRRRDGAHVGNVACPTPRLGGAQERATVRRNTLTT